MHQKNNIHSAYLANNQDLIQYQNVLQLDTIWFISIDFSLSLWTYLDKWSPLFFIFCRWKQTFRVDFHKKKNVIIHFLRYDAFLESSKTTIFLRVWYTIIIYRFHMCISYCKYFCIYTFSPLPIVKPIKRSEAKAIISYIHFSSSQRGRNLMSYKSQAR